MSTADDVRPWELARYLQLQGWAPNDTLSDDDVEVYESASVRDERGEPVRLFAPRSADLPDFAVMREDLVRALAALEGQSPEAMLAALRVLRQPAGPRHRTLIGHVVELRARRSALPIASEQVVMLSTELDGKSQLVRISLEDRDYQTACVAHLERRPVRVVGVLERVRKTWQVTRYDAFDMEHAPTPA